MMKLNQNCEAPSNLITNDYRDENTQSFACRVFARGLAEICDSLFNPVINMHTGAYRTADERWG